MTKYISKIVDMRDYLLFTRAKYKRIIILLTI